MVYTLRTFGGLQVEGPNGQPSGITAQRRSLALLVVIAAASERGVSRDTLAAMLWPGSDEDRARRALAQTLYRVRQQLGAGVIRGGDRLSCDPALITTDLLQLESAFESGDYERVVELHRGPFLDGFHLQGAPELERWADGERQRLSRVYRDSLERLALAAEERGEMQRAIHWWELAAAADPLNARVAAALIRARGAAGDATGAMQTAKVHEARVREELDAEPDPLVVRAAEEVRAEKTPAAGATGSGSMEGARPAASQAVETQPMQEVEPPASSVAASDRARSADTSMFDVSRQQSARRRPALIALACVTLIVAIAVPAAASLLGNEPVRSESDAAPVLAVGEIVDRTGDTSAVARVLPELLTTSLGRFGTVQVVSRPRLREIAARGASEPDLPAFHRAAADAGAELLLEGALYRLPSGAARLDLRMVSLERRTIGRAYQLEGSDPFALADSAALRVVRDLGRVRPVQTAKHGVTARSIAALQLYDEGLRAYYAGDATSAERMFAAALEKDTTFAMAAYYAYKSAFGYSARARAYLEEARRRARWASDRERLIIGATWAAFNFDPQELVLAESSSTLFPADPEARVLLGNARVTSGDFAGAATAYRAALDLDAGGVRDGAAACTACDAIHGLVQAYLLSDSLESAERVARDWTRRQPRSAHASLTLASVLGTGSDTAGAAAAFRRRAALVPYAPEEWQMMISIALRAGDFDRVDRLLTGMRASESASTRNEALWWLTIARRYEGRLDDALDAATALVRASGEDDAGARQLYAQVLLEMGRAQEAAAVFESVERHWRAAPAASEGLRSRRVTWAMTHRATALAAAGDTAALARLVEPIRATGALSGYGRDRRLHHYARALLLAARGSREEATVELRAAIYSPNLGYTRINLELGRLYLELGHPREAIDVLRPALRGSIEASNLYVTHTELHALLARAFAAIASPDSAAAHRAYVSRAMAGVGVAGRAASRGPSSSR
ncbi:MAG TPA: BTAD domain-containing putative transcriptional regulator [Gemmatimonadaceae bacterium]|nr:BTAD domain-containing putative transcriptional regulator [Gemmatimonadaceae bacterium]